MRFYRYGLVLALIAVIALSVVGCSKEPMAATVNGKGIPMAEIDMRLKQMVGENQEALVGPDGEKLKAQYSEPILDQLIEIELMRQEAEKRGVKVSDKDLDAKVKEMMKAYGIKDEAALKTILKQQSTTLEQFKNEFRIRMMIEKLGDKLAEDIKISDKKAQDYYNKNKSEFFVKDQIHASHILVQKEEDAKKILAELKKGADFAKLAKKHSIDTNSQVKGGDLSWMPKEQFVPEFAEACWKLNPGQISEQPVKTDYGFHIIKLIGKKAAYQPTFKEAKSKVKDKLLIEVKREKFNDHLVKVKKEADIKKYITPPSSEALSGPAPGAPGSTPGGSAVPAPTPQPGQ